MTFINKIKMSAEEISMTFVYKIKNGLIPLECEKEVLVNPKYAYWFAKYVKGAANMLECRKALTGTIYQDYFDDYFGEL